MEEEMSKARIATGIEGDDFGFFAALEGDLHGATKFAHFIKQKLVEIGASSELPEALKFRFSILHREAERLAHFADGFEAATHQTREESE
jgi:hypothetical protein